MIDEARTSLIPSSLPMRAALDRACETLDVLRLCNRMPEGGPGRLRLAASYLRRDRSRSEPASLAVRAWGTFQPENLDELLRRLNDVAARLEALASDFEHMNRRELEALAAEVEDIRLEVVAQRTPVPDAAWRHSELI